MGTMNHRPRELAGAVNRADRVLVWVEWTAGKGAYFDVTKTFARGVLNAAREDAAKTGVAVVIVAKVERGTVYIGSAALPMPRSVTDAPRAREGIRTMSEQETTGGETENEDDEDTCDACGKTATSEFDVPPGWFLMKVTCGHEDEDEDAEGLVCSSECAKNWLDSGCP